jgi:ABC-2 type transport system ATP-binding protein/lipopolysaccharide transport system ATP-binding protein
MKPLTVLAKKVRLSYPIHGAVPQSLRGTLVERLYGRGIASPGSRSFTALQNVSFESREGDRVALIGPNGAGKSTLLRIIADIFQPDSGEIKRFGSVLPLLGVLPGISPDASGYENVKLSAYSLGIKPDQLPEIVTEVESFAELGEFMALPIRTYSSGMVARLFFAIVTSLSAEIFVMDEFSFVSGDASFQEKARLRARRLLDRAKTVFIASHDENVVTNICNKAIYLSQGNIVAFGDVRDVLNEYNSAVAAGRG